MITWMETRKHEWLGPPSSDITGGDSAGRGGDHAAVCRNPAYSTHHYRPFCHAREFSGGNRTGIYRERFGAKHLAGGDRCLPVGWVARALRHCAGVGPVVRRDAGAECGAGIDIPDLLTGALEKSWPSFSITVSVPHNGSKRRVPDGRLVQPVCICGSAAGRVIRPPVAWLGRTPRQGWLAL